MAKRKVGHGGTLDPLATGVLPVAVGEATKLAGRMLDSDKVYDFTIGFGEETDTLDLEGKVVAESDVRPTLADVEAVFLVHRRNRSDATGLFGAEGRWRTCIRSGAGGRDGDAGDPQRHHSLAIPSSRT